MISGRWTSEFNDAFRKAFEGHTIKTLTTTGDSESRWRDRLHPPAELHTGWDLMVGIGSRPLPYVTDWGVNGFDELWRACAEGG